jgi:regulator of sigma E protease
MFASIGSILLLAFGFGFVIFFHELGHFLAAKWADVKVEQFAVGFGNAAMAWRKGMGFRIGSTQREFHDRINQHIEQHLAEQGTPSDKPHDPTDEQIGKAAQELGISETEYRLNWIPLGGYVKMLGQDDLKPGVIVNDPRSYNSKTIGQRMVIVSAGVIMNVILAAIGFMIVFLMGLPASPAMVGGISPGSPAQDAYRIVNGSQQPAPLQAGDTILTLDGRPQADFTKIGMNIALSAENQPIVMDVLRANGTHDKVWVVPAKPKDESKSFMMLGIEQPYELRGIEEKSEKDLPEATTVIDTKDPLAIHPGERVVAVAGAPVSNPRDFYLLDEALQKSAGRPVDLTLVDSAGHQRTIQLQTTFDEPFSKDALNFAGMLPRTLVESVMKDSPAEKAKIQSGDVIVEVASAKAGGDRKLNPSRQAVMDWFSEAGTAGESVNVTVLRDGKKVVIPSVTPNYAVGGGRKGVGIQLNPEMAQAVVGGRVKDSPAEIAKIPEGATIVSIDGHDVHTWGDVDTQLKQIPAGQPFTVEAQVEGKNQPFTFGPLSESQTAEMHQNRYIAEPPYGQLLLFHDYARERKTTNPLIAAQWGVGETRDAIAQVYLTVRRMTEGSVSYKNVSGPLGILVAGYGFANKSLSWLIWFLSIISANLAVMNFLPIPIVDGGLFTFLIIEKIKGGPISPRVQAIAQVVGLAILLSVFLLATYQDLFRLPFFNH